MCIRDSTRTAVAHSISYPITAHYGVPHGLACSFTLEAILRDNIDSLSRDMSETVLFKDILSILKDLELGRMIQKFINFRDMQNLYPEMITKSRADNFSEDFVLEKIVSDSMEFK